MQVFVCNGVDDRTRSYSREALPRPTEGPQVAFDASAISHVLKRRTAERRKVSARPIHLLPASSGRIVSRPGHPLGEHSGVLSVAFSPEGARVVSGGGEEDKGQLKLWNAATGALIRTFEAHSAWVNSVVFSPDGARVLSGSYDRTIKLW